MGTTVISKEQAIAYLDTAKSLYIGKRNSCCCGCSGKHFEKSHKEFEGVKMAFRKKKNAWLHDGTNKDYCYCLTRDKIFIIYQD